MIMQYNFVDEPTAFGNLESKENIHLYPTHAQQDKYYMYNMVTTNDPLQSSTSNPNSNYQSDYQPLPDISLSYLVDRNSPTLTNSYQIDPYLMHSTPTDYSSAGYISPTRSYQYFYPMYMNTNDAAPSGSTFVDTQADYQSISSSWNSSAIKMHGHSFTPTSNSNKQLCVSCPDESPGYHFGTYTCESYKTDSNIEMKPSCEVPLPNITKSNRGACCKVKYGRVETTVMPKDRIPQTKTTFKSSSISINNLLEQLAYDLTHDQLSSSLALENLLYLLDLPSIISIKFDYHSLYINAIRIWRNQFNHSLQINVNDTFPVLLFLFYTLTIMKEHDHSINSIKFDKLIHILQQEIHRITGIDQQLASRIKALFMKCFVALAQYNPNSTTYEQYPIYGQ